MRDELGMIATPTSHEFSKGDVVYFKPGTSPRALITPHGGLEDHDLCFVLSADEDTALLRWTGRHRNEDGSDSNSLCCRFGEPEPTFRAQLDTLIVHRVASERRFRETLCGFITESPFDLIQHLAAEFLKQDHHAYQAKLSKGTLRDLLHELERREIDPSSIRLDIAGPAGWIRCTVDPDVGNEVVITCSIGEPL